MDTNVKIDFLNRQLIGYASLVYDEESLDYSIDSEVTSTCKVKVQFESNFDFESRVSRRDFIYIGDVDLLGMVIDFTVDSDSSATVMFVIGADVLNHDVRLQTTQSANIGTTLVNKLTSEFVSTTFTQSKLPLVFQNASTRIGTLYSPDGVIEWAKLWRQIKRLFNVDIHVKLTGSQATRKLIVSISDYAPSNFIIAVGDSDLYEYSAKIAGDQTTRYTAFDNANNFVYYLKKDGGVTTNQNDANLVTQFVDEKEYFKDGVTSTEALEKATNEMQGKYDNNIQMRLSKKRYIQLELGDKVAFVLKNKNYIESVVTSKKETSKRRYDVVLGTARRRLTDKLKKERR